MDNRADVRIIIPHISHQPSHSSPCPFPSSITNHPCPSPSRYLKVIDKFFNNYISCFITAGNVKFLLLHQPTGSTTTTAPSGLTTTTSSLTNTSSASSSTRNSTSIGANPTSPQTEEAIKNFFQEVYENYIKAIMSPFYRVNQEIKSPVFRSRVAAVGRKYL